MAASSFQFRSHFKPDVVLIDEAVRLPEAELLILVAWFSGPWTLVGDKYQLSPFLRTDPSAKNTVQSNNPFVRQVGYSTLARAVDAGATISYMRFNHRSLGNLTAAPSELIYRGVMDVPAKRQRHTQSVLALNAIPSKIRMLPRTQSSILVALKGSWVGTLGTSSYNLAHVRWALEQVRSVLEEDNITSVRGGKATVLVMPFYRAQLQKYMEAFHQLVDCGAVAPGDAERVRFATLDSSQGDEADFCIVDLVNTDSVGFTGDEPRLCLTLTRARQGQIVIANPGTFIGLEGVSHQASRGVVVRRLYTYFEANRATASIPTCVFCETPNPDHN